MKTNFIPDALILSIARPKMHVTEPPQFVVCKTDEWAVVALKWDQRRTLAIRWFTTPMGNPSSHGYPTWYILPEELHESILDFAAKEQHTCVDKIKDYLNNK